MSTAGQGWRVVAAAAVAYAALTLVLTYPTAAHLGTRMIGDGGDGYQFAWNLWWMKRALIDLQVSPFFTDALYYPHGVTLWLHTLSPLNGVLSIPLQALFDLPVAYNLLVLLSFVAAGVAAFLLAYDLTGAAPSAFLGGIVYTFSSYHFAHALGHLNLVACQWLPLFALFLIRTLREGGVSNALGTGLSFALNAYTDPYYLLYASLLGAMLVVAHWGDGRDRRRRVLGLAWAAASGGVLSGPYIFAMVRAARAQPFLGAHPAHIFSADLTAYFVPNAISSFGAFTQDVWSRWSGNSTENACFLGFTVLALTVMGLVKVRASRAWGVIGGVFFVLSLGPELRVFGRATGVVLHYELLHRFVPFFDLSGVPVRMDVMVELSAAVLVAYAARGWPPGVIAALGVLIVVERLALPYPTRPVEVDPFYREIAADAEPYALLDVDNQPNVAMYLATVHRKPIVGGMVARLPAVEQQFIDDTPVLPTLLYGWPLSPGDPVELGRKMCERLQVRYAVTRDPVRRDLMKRILRLPPVRESEALTVFACPR